MRDAARMSWSGPSSSSRKTGCSGLVRDPISCRIRHPRESGGPVQTARRLPWVPAFAQGCPGKLGISQSELVLNIGRRLRGWWRLVEVGNGSMFEQTRAHEVCEAQGEQVRAAVARGDAQQQIGDHCGQDLQADGVFGTAEKGADFEMLLDPTAVRLISE